MKKDKEWLNNEVKERIEEIKTDKISCKGSDFFDEGYIQGMKYVQAIANQLDELEVLSQEWMDKNTVYSDVKGSAEAFLNRDNVKNLLVPKQENTRMTKQEIIKECGMSESEWAEVIDRYKWHLEQENYVVIEKPTVPQFVFDWIEESKDANILAEIFYLESALPSQNMREEHEIYFWLKNNFNTFAKAWLNYQNIGVEEPKYYALIKGHEHIQGEEKYWNYDEENETLEVGRNRVQDDVLTDYTIQVTLKEWEDLGVNEYNAEFVKVNE